ISLKSRSESEDDPLCSGGVNENFSDGIGARISSDLLLLGALDVLGLQAFGAFDNFEVHNFPFVQGFEPLSLNGGVMHEDILAGILGDEAKPFLIVEPLDFTTGHNLLLFSETQNKRGHSLALTTK